MGLTVCVRSADIGSMLACEKHRSLHRKVVKKELHHIGSFRLCEAHQCFQVCLIYDVLKHGLQTVWT